jgi:hypothetical protein
MQSSRQPLPIRVLFFVSVWFSLLGAVVAWCTATAILLVVSPKVGMVSAMLVVMSLCVPLDVAPPSLVTRFLEASMDSFIEYLPVEIALCGWKSCNSTTKYVIAYEPHGVLPVLMCLFSAVRKPSWLGLPKELDGAAILVSDAVFRVPILRNLWYWLGLRSVSRQSMRKLLDEEGKSVVLCPGGATECLTMRRHSESVYLNSRKGFVRMAKIHGAAIVPVFSVNQSSMFRYWRPLYDRPSTRWTRKMFVLLAKWLKFVPMLAWGRYGSPLPFRQRVTVVIGEPLFDIADITDTLDEFIERIKFIYISNAARAGNKKPPRLEVF